MAGMQETDRLTMKNGITYLLQDAKARAQLAELLAEVMEKYGADNPPPYPVTSVNGQTGDVDIPTVDLPVSVQNGGTGATSAAQAAKNLGVLPLGEVVTKIPSGADLNDYVSPGVYAIGYDDTVATIANIPSQFAGTLRVFAGTGAEITASSTWKYLIQEYTTYTGARYQRTGRSGSGTAVTWGSWETIYTSADLSMPVPVSQGGTGADNAAGARENLGAVNIAGDTMTGDLTVRKQGEVNIYADNTKSGEAHKVSLCVGSSGKGGIWDETLSKWLIALDRSGLFYCADRVSQIGGELPGLVSNGQLWLCIGMRNSVAESIVVLAHMHSDTMYMTTVYNTSNMSAVTNNQGTVSLMYGGSPAVVFTCAIRLC